MKIKKKNNMLFNITFIFYDNFLFCFMYGYSVIWFLRKWALNSMNDRETAKTEKERNKKHKWNREGNTSNRQNPMVNRVKKKKLANISLSARKPMKKKTKPNKIRWFILFDYVIICMFNRLKCATRCIVENLWWYAEYSKKMKEKRPQITTCLNI